MKFLLDTHTFIWCVSESSRLSEKAKREISSPNNEVYISSVNLWEIAIKSRIRRVDLGEIEVEDLIGFAEEMGIQLIGLSPEEAVSYGRLEEDSHFDPFDRMLIWQAINRKLTLISKDRRFEAFVPHGLKLFWK